MPFGLTLHKLIKRMPWQIAVQVAKRYFPQAMLPITITVGFIGYTIESSLRSPRTVERSRSVAEMREERRLEEMEKR